MTRDFSIHADGTLTNAEAAAYLGIQPTYLHNLRHFGKGPAFTKLSGRIYYRKSDLDVWDKDRTARKAKRSAGAKAKLKKAA